MTLDWNASDGALKKAALYRLVQEHAETFLAHVAIAAAAGFPRSAKAELDALEGVQSKDKARALHVAAAA